MKSWGIVTGPAARDPDGPLGRGRAAAGAAFAGSRCRGGSGRREQSALLWHAGEWLRPLPLRAVRRGAYGLLHLQEPLLPVLRPSPGCRGRGRRAEPLAQCASSPPDVFGPFRTAAPPVPATGVTLCGRAGRCSGNADGGGHALPQASPSARGDGDAAHLRSRPALPRPRACALHRRRAASRRRLAAGLPLSSATVPPALAVLPSLGTATPPQRRPRCAAVAGQSLSQVSHRLHCQRDEPLPKRAAGGSLLLPLHRSPAAVGAAHLRVRW